MKSYTDIEQSKKLAEILPLESADMFIADVVDPKEQTHSYNFHILITWGYKTFAEIKERELKYAKFIPCWSLSALLEQFEDTAGLAKDYGLWFCYDNRKSYCTKHYDNQVDACYEMIIKLHEEKVL